MASSTARRRSSDGSGAIGIPVPVLAYLRSDWNRVAGLMFGALGALGPDHEMFMVPPEPDMPTWIPFGYSVPVLVIPAAT